MRARAIALSSAIVSTLTWPITAQSADATPSVAPSQAPSISAACDPVDPAACLLPFPNDYFTRRDRGTATGIRVDFDRLAMPANALGVHVDPAEWNLNDGFSPGSPILTHAPGLDLGKTGAAPVTDIGRSLDRRAPIVLINTRTGRRHPYWAELDTNATDPDRRALIIRPARNLDEGTRYVVGLRNLRDSADDALEPNDTFTALMSHRPPQDDKLMKRWAYAQRALRELRQAGISDRNLYLAWDFTVASTRSLTERVLHMRNEALEQLGSAVPSYEITKIQDFAANENPLTLRRIEGTVNVPSYLNTPFGLPGSWLNKDANGIPRRLPLNVQKARFICNVPRSATPDNPARPALYGHGLLGDPAEVNSNAQQTYGFESNSMLCATPWIGMAREDIPNVIASLTDVSQFPSVPDRSQQGFLDFLFLGRAMSHRGGFANTKAFQDDRGRPLTTNEGLAYLGNSQGGILGGALTALGQDFTNSMLGVPAMNYSTLLNRSVDFDQFKVVFDPSYPDKLDQQIVFALMQMVWDRGEANGYANHMTKNPLPGTPKHRVLLIEAVGDHQVANVATEVEARTIGAKLRQPAIDTGRSRDVKPFWEIPPRERFPYEGSILVIVDSGSPLPPTTNTPPYEGADPHSHPRNSPEVRAMVAHFLDTGKVIDTCESLPCKANPG